MNDKEIIEDVFKIVTQISGKGNEYCVSESSALIGPDKIMDSMKLIELCLALEDKAADIGFRFDWTSESAMSKSRGMFRNVGTLANEFLSQMSGRK
jgi:hypothetical protein